VRGGAEEGRGPECSRAIGQGRLYEAMTPGERGVAGLEGVVRGRGGASGSARLYKGGSLGGGGVSWSGVWGGGAGGGLVLYIQLSLGL
jgi:hypothetical protein